MKGVSEMLARRAKDAAWVRGRIDLALKRLEKCARFRGKAGVVDPLCMAWNSLSALETMLKEEALRNRDDDG